MLWRDNAKMRWIEEGDSNTHFFHLSTVIHRRHNHVSRIIGPQNNQLHDRSDIGDAFEHFYKGLFNFANPPFPIHLQGLVYSCISDSINCSLIAVPTGKEILEALTQMSSLIKNPGTDHFTVIFYKTFQGMMRFDWYAKRQSLLTYVDYE